MATHGNDDSTVDEAPGRLTRRELIKRAAVVGGVAAWGVPLVRLALDNGGDSGLSVKAGELSSEGAITAAFPATCQATPLDGGVTERLVCARNVRSAESAFRATVRTECSAKCGAAPCPSGSCRSATRTPTSIGTVTCEPTGTAGCPQELYGRGMTEFRCRATVTCNCECR